MSKDKKKTPNTPDISETGGEPKSWDHLRNSQSSHPVPETPKPWPEELEKSAEDFVQFLKHSEGKKAINDFIIDAYKKYESDKIAQIKARVEAEMKPRTHPSSSGTSRNPGAPGIPASNIAPLVHDDLNMSETENAFARGLRTTKATLVRSVEDRVEDINRLMANIGGFSAQIKSSFARSVVVFLEQEDPEHTFRDRLIFSVNLPNYELKKPWDHSPLFVKKTRQKRVGRGSFQMTWDDAVNALARIVETTGLKPKYCKNDRNYGRFIMKQELRTTDHIPDEYFSFTLDYNTEEKINQMKEPYAKIVGQYETRIKKLSNQLKRYPSDSKNKTYLNLKKKYRYLCQDRDFFIGTTPDPNQLDEGLLFLIEVSTLQDYHIVKDRMQSIMTRYILYLSKIAAEEAHHDSELEYQLSKTGGGGPKGRRKKNDAQADLSPDEFKDIPQYVIEAGKLRELSPASSKMADSSNHSSEFQGEDEDGDESNSSQIRRKKSA